jgi:hypothetical protein
MNHKAVRLFLRAFAIMIAVCFALLLAKWPFTSGRVRASLERALESDVSIQKFHYVFFPSPGCDLDGVTVTRDSGSDVRTLATAGRVRIRDSWHSLLTFRHRVANIRAESLHVSIPERAPQPVNVDFSNTQTIVGEFVADGGILEFERDKGPMRFEFHRFTANDVGKNSRIAFRTEMRIPEPPGELKSKGTFGPWQTGRVGSTPVLGSFELSDADLGHYRGIDGKVSGSGSFDGNLERIAVWGRAETPDFKVTKSEHSVHLSTEYKAVVDGLTGRTELSAIDARFLGTELSARGVIARNGSETGKTASLDFESAHARLQDLLWLMDHAAKPPASGPMAFHAHVVLPPGKLPFLQKVQLDGGFVIRNAHFERANAQRAVNDLSARASGEKGEDEDKEEDQSDEVAAEMEGRVHLRQGVAYLEDAAFDVPGAIARGGGIFNVITAQVDLHGELLMDVSLSKASRGVKSVLLKSVNIFFKRKHGPGSKVPVYVRGSYSQPSIGVALTGNK